MSTSAGDDDDDDAGGYSSIWSALEITVRGEGMGDEHGPGQAGG